MFSKDTPNFNSEIIRWLIAYFLIDGNEKTKTVYEKLINFAKMNPSEFINTVNEMITNGHVTKDTKPVYDLKPKSKKVLEVTNYQHLYSLTQEGKKQLRLGWQFVSSAIPKELYDEITVKIPFIEK